MDEVEQLRAALQTSDVIDETIVEDIPLSENISSPPKASPTIPGGGNAYPRLATCYTTTPNSPAKLDAPQTLHQRVSEPQGRSWQPDTTGVRERRDFPPARFSQALEYNTLPAVQISHLFAV